MGRATTQKVISELRKIKRKASLQYDIKKMYLFGSRARGEELLSSDVDLIVVSLDFSSLPFRARPDLFLALWKLPLDFEVLCYTPQELKRKQKELGLVRDALSYALE